MGELNYADIAKMYAAGPACDNHKPEPTIDSNKEGWCIMIHCKNCGFLGWAHPETYKQMNPKAYARLVKEAKCKK